jgi:predicted permease
MSRSPHNDRALTFWAKMKALFGQRIADGEFAEEMRVHLEMLTEKFEREGMSAKDAARAARRQFGNTTLLKQKQHESRTTMFFANVWRDVRYGARQLAKTPVFTLVCVLTLALGIGANTAVFSVMHAVLAKMLPVQRPEELVILHGVNKPRGAYDTGDGDTSLSYAIYKAMGTRKDTFQDVMTYIPLAASGKAAVRIGSTPEVATGDMVSGNYFSALGVGMQLGHGFSPRDEEQHSTSAVLSAKYWASRFASDPAILGKTIYVKSIPFTIVGVAAESFEGSEGSKSVDFWIPLSDRPELNAWGAAISKDGKNYRTDPKWWSIRVMARLAPGVTKERALAQIQPTYQQAAYNGLESFKKRDVPPTVKFADAKQYADAGDSFSKTLKVLMAMVALVLLIAVSNVVMLLVARNANRQREFSIRLSLGAGRRELARQLLVESFLLVTVGGAVAWAFALGATKALGAWARYDAALQPDTLVMWFTLGLLLLAALVFGLAPLRGAMSNKPEMVLKSSSTVSQSDTQKVRSGNAVIVTQVALCVVLLVGAGLLFGTLRNLVNTPLGQQTEGLLVFGAHPQHVHSKDESVNFYQTLQQRLLALPGVTAVSMASNRPGSGWSSNNGGFLLDGHKPNGHEMEDTEFRNNDVGSNYFHTMGVQVVAGRDFTDADSITAPRTAIVNETFVKKYAGNGGIVGHMLSDSDNKNQLQIVGVVKDHKYTGITEEARPMLWTPFPQEGQQGELNYEVRVQGDPMEILPTIRKVVAQMDPDMPLLQPMTQEAQFRQSISQQVLFARLAGCFGVLAVVLIATGLYGTLSYRVSRRSAEIGVRMALGAQRSQVVWMVLRGSLVLCAVGVVIGVPLAMAAGRGLESSLYGMKPLNLASYVFAVLGVGVVALLASALPAVRAASVDPSSALRAE